MTIHIEQKQSTSRGTSRIFAAWCLLLVFSALPGLAEASVRAWTDRTTLYLGETVTLNVELTGSMGTPTPDFSVLSRDFELLGTSTNTQIQYLSGQQSISTVWAVALEPLREGVITLPSIQVGSQATEPFQLTVLPPEQVAPDQLADIIVEVELGPQRVYVQQQMLLQVRLLYAVTLTEGALSSPDLSQAIVDQLGTDSSYTTQRGGRRYQVLERRYAVTPEQSGTLELPSIRFEGRAMDRQQGRIFDRGRRVEASAEPRSVEVMPRPAGSGSGPWLPAQELTLQTVDGDWPQQATVGEPLSVALRLSATGLSESQLPDIELPNLANARVYPEQASGRRRNDTEWMYGERTRRFAIIPAAAGYLDIPDIEVEWWNTRADRAERAVLKGARIAVAPAASMVSPAISDTASGTVETDSSASSGVELRVWQALFGLALAAWLITWLRLRRVRGAETEHAAPVAEDSVSARAAARAFRLAIARRDPSSITQALLRWASSKREGAQIRSATALMAVLDDPSQRQLLDRLQRVSYAGVDDPELIEALDRGFSSGPVLGSEKRRGGANRGSPGLPPLYPQR